MEFTMRITLVLIAAGALFISGCKTTESASARGHEILVKVDNHDTGGEDGKRKIDVIILRDGEDFRHIEGDPDSPEVQAQLAMLKAEGIHVMDDSNQFRHSGSDGESHKWIMKHGDEKDLGDNADVDMFVTIDGEHITIGKNGAMEEVGSDGSSVDFEAMTLEDGKHIIIKKDGKTEAIIIPDEADGKHVFVLKDGEHLKHEGRRKKVIVIEGGNEEDVREQLKELGVVLEFGFDEEVSEEENVEK